MSHADSTAAIVYAFAANGHRARQNRRGNLDWFRFVTGGSDSFLCRLRHSGLVVYRHEMRRHRATSDGLWSGIVIWSVMVVIGKDLAALLGLVLAATTPGLTLMTGNPFCDAPGSILIGMLLIIVAALVGHEVHSLLLGEADKQIRDRVRIYLENQPSVNRALNLWTISHGRQVMVAIKAGLQADWTVRDAVEAINAMEKQIKIDHPRINWVFFEIDNSD